MNNNAPVTLIAHSMGGPMSLIFLQRQNQKWKDKYINSMITLAGVWGGSVKALKVFAIGKAKQIYAPYLLFNRHQKKILLHFSENFNYFTFISRSGHFFLYITYFEFF